MKKFKDRLLYWLFLFKFKRKKKYPHISVLVDRPVIKGRNKYPEFFNKMTGRELLNFEKDIEKQLDKENVPRKFPDWNAAYLAKIIDYEILYNLYKEIDNPEIYVK